MERKLIVDERVDCGGGKAILVGHIDKGDQPGEAAAQSKVSQVIDGSLRLPSGKVIPWTSASEIVKREKAR
ncbi:MAG: hypothetical protein PHW72_03790 [Candidatus Pacebacteria bacterium]|nr:hypothetical protein [Candidatus Paceibacterota bacterium]